MINNLLQQIKYFYGLNSNCANLIESYFKTDSSDLIALQQDIIDNILNDKILNRYQPFKKYQRSFLKTIINAVEKQNEEVNETLFKIYIQLLNNDQSSSNEEKYFIVYYSKVKGNI